MSGRRGLRLVLAAACVLYACDRPEPPRRPRGIAPGEATGAGAGAAGTSIPASSEPVSPPPTSPPPPRSLPSPFMQAAPNPGALARDAGEPQAEAAAAAQAPADAGPPRDLSGELRALLGQPASCLDLAAVESAGGRLTISATAYVVPSGRITRARATAPGQPPAAVRCIEQRITTGSLRGPVAGAPLEVTTSVPVEVITQRAVPR